MKISKSQMLRALYTIGFTLLTPLLILRLYYKSLRAPLYAQRIPERFGFFKAPEKKGAVWIHAVSVGEVVAAIPIVRYLQQKYPCQPIVFTTMTPMGSNRVKQDFGDQVFHLYIPYDFPWALNRFFSNIAPKLCIILETELWPNVLSACKIRQIPVIIANAHLSERSVRGYQRIRPMTQEMLHCLTAVAAQSQQDADRFLQIGLDAKKLSVMGNIKFDVPSSDSTVTADNAQLWRKSFKPRPVWIAASTHPGEEALVLEAFKIIRKSASNALLILVPRHPERFKGIEDLVKQQNMSVVTRSSGAIVQTDTAVFLGDTMGELLAFYQAADIAFVGGSLVPIGGHNLLEPAALGIPIITGPYLHNYVEISSFLLEAKGMLKVENPTELATTVLQWFKMPEQRLEAGQSAQQVVKNNQGTAQRVFDLIDRAWTH